MNYKLFTIIAILLLVVSVSATKVTLVPSTDVKLSRTATSENFSVMRDEVGTSLVNATGSQTLVGYAAHASDSGNYTAFVRYGWCNNSAFLPDDAVISSASFGVYGTAETHGLGNLSIGLIGFNPTSTTNITFDDYNKTVFTMYSDTNISAPSWDEAGWNTFTLNTAGKNAINKTAGTCVMLATPNDISNNMNLGTNNRIVWLASQNSVFKGYLGAQGAPYIPNITITYTSEIENTTAVYENTMDFYPSIDGYVLNQTESPYANLSEIRGANSSTYGCTTATYAYNYLGAATGSKLFRYTKPLIGFNTSGLPDTATIISANLSLYASGSSYQYTGLGTFNYTPTKWLPATNGSISSYGDYDNFDDTPYSTFSGITANSRNNWSLNSEARANISKTGYTNYMIRPWWDVYNDSTNVTLVDWARTDFRFYTTEMGDPYIPVLTINYNYTVPDGVYFTTNLTQTDNLPPTQNVTFTDTSVGSYTVANRVWRYYDYGTLPELPCAPAGECPLGGYPKQWNIFNQTSNESTLTYRWGSGNWSIELDRKDTTGEWHNSTPGYSWVNISAGSTGGLRLNSTHTFFPADNIFRQNISTSPVHAKSATWIAQMKMVMTDTLGGHTAIYSSSQVPYPAYNISVYRKETTTQNRYFIINSSIPKQKLLNNNRSTDVYHQYDYGTIGGLGGFPIPDDVKTMQGGTDHAVDFIDPDTNIIWHFGNGFKQNNGTWSSSSVIWNASSNCYRFSADGTSPYGDNGCTWLGNKWYDVLTLSSTLTPRRELFPTYYPSDAGIGIAPLTLMYDEVESGEVKHPLWITIHSIGGGGAWPAISDSTENNHCRVADSECAPAGGWLRLKSSVNLTERGMGTGALNVVGTAMKNYGIIIINDGSVMGTINKQYDDRWNTTNLHYNYQYFPVTIDDFEFIDVSSLMVDRYTLQAKTNTPIASFTQDFTNGYSPLPVQFTDTTTGNATSWSWDFGDGNYSITQSPSHTYYGTSNYTVTLEACNTVGCSEVSHYVSLGTPSTIIAVIYHHLQQFFLLARLV